MEEYARGQKQEGKPSRQKRIDDVQQGLRVTLKKRMKRMRCKKSQIQQNLMIATKCVEWRQEKRWLNLKLKNLKLKNLHQMKKLICFDLHNSLSKILRDLSHAPSATCNSTIHSLNIDFPMEGFKDTKMIVQDFLSLIRMNSTIISLKRRIWKKT